MNIIICKTIIGALKNAPEMNEAAPFRPVGKGVKTYRYMRSSDPIKPVGT
jgi:hypothetical protein